MMRAILIGLVLVTSAVSRPVMGDPVQPKPDPVQPGPAKDDPKNEGDKPKLEPNAQKPSADKPAASTDPLDTFTGGNPDGRAHFDEARKLLKEDRQAEACAKFAE